MKSLTQRFNRRQFLRVTATTAAPLIVPASALGRTRRFAPGERITLGVVGLGARGFRQLMESSLLSSPDAQIVAICDVDAKHYRDREWGDGKSYGREPAKQRIVAHYGKDAPGGQYRGLGVSADYRELCGRDDLDAVVIATPDHWHALIALESLRAGKDIYREKPLTRRFREGQLVYREAAARNAVFQVGS